MQTNLKRRTFLRNAGSVLASFPFIARAAQVPASERIRVAHVGVGSKGRTHINWFANMPDIDVVALSDVDSTHLNASLAHLAKIQPKAPPAQGYADFRRILERKDVDVITYASPDHWHALMAISAFEAGKDVYGEKPLSYSLREGQRMEQVMRRTKRVFQLGTQIHAGDNYHRISEIIRSGQLGTIHTVRLWKTGGSPGLGFPANQTPPDHLDWNTWLGPAPLVPYTPARCHGTFRYFFDYSGGVFGDFWCHIADLLYMALEPSGLYSIDARGAIPQDGIADTPRRIDVDFKFKNLNVFWTTDPPAIPHAAKMGIGAHFEGTKGTMTCDYDQRFITINGETVNDLPQVPITLPRSPGHQRNFLDAVKTRATPESNLPYARQMALPMHLALTSFRLKRPLTWDHTKEVVVGDAAANYLLGRVNRKPFDW